MSAADQPDPFILDVEGILQEALDSIEEAMLAGQTIEATLDEGDGPEGDEFPLLYRPLRLARTNVKMVIQDLLAKRRPPGADDDDESDPSTSAGAS